MSRRDLILFATGMLSGLFFLAGIAGLVRDALPVYIPPSPSPIAYPSFTPSFLPSPAPSITPAPSFNPFPSFGPDPSLQPSPSPSATPSTAIPTRVVVTGMGIDLPIVAPAKDESFPLCGVAEYIASFGLPGGRGITYLYAHARTGMFLPLLTSFLLHGTTSLIGRNVTVYTNDHVAHYYTIDAVFPHVLNWDNALKAPPGDLILQTSETPTLTGTKMMVRATPTGTRANQVSSSTVTPQPIVCSL